MNLFELFGIVVVAVIAWVFGYSSGQTKGWNEGVMKSFRAFLDEGFYDGWRARHYLNPLKDNRVHPEEIQRLMPTIIDPGQELSDWMFNFSHLPFEEYRAQKIAKLNEEMELGKKFKNQKPES
jgi:hypothetical protein